MWRKARRSSFRARASSISRRSSGRPHTIVPDELQKNPQPLKIYGVFEKHDDQGRNGRGPSLTILRRAAKPTRGSAIRMSTACSSAMWSTASSSMSPTSSRRAALPSRVRRTRLPSATRLREFDVEDRRDDRRRARHDGQTSRDGRRFGRELRSAADRLESTRQQASEGRQINGPSQLAGQPDFRM